MAGEIEQSIFERYRHSLIDGVPKYAQLREVLMAAIDDGYWKPGERLPNEKDLAAQSALSLGTVQRAMRALVDHGLVVRRQGEGTFVTKHNVAMDAPWHCRFVGDAPGTLLPVYPKIVARESSVKTGASTRALGGQICRIDRVIWIGNEFRVYSRFYISAKRFDAFGHWPISGLQPVNFKTILRQQYNVNVRSVVHYQRITAFPADICSEIGISAECQGLVLEITAYGARDNAVYYQELYVPPTERRLVIEGQPPRMGGG